MFFASGRCFAVSYDRTSKLFTGLMIALLAGLCLVAQNWYIAGLMGVVVLAIYAYSPREYAISAQSIVVRRLIGNVEIPIGKAIGARPATRDDLRGAIRLWGSGGMFGYFGLFRTTGLGKSTWYVTSRANAVVVVTPLKTAVFSPDDVPGFLAAIQGFAPGASIPVGNVVRSEGSRPGGIAVRAWLGVPVLVLVAGVAAFAFLYAPGPPELTLTVDSLTIRDRFYPYVLKASDVDISNIRVVDLDAEQGWVPKVRTNGFANAHYEAGMFRVNNGRRVRLYKTGGHRLLLFPSKGNGTPVLLEVAEPEGFLNELERTWGSRPAA